MYMPQQPMHGTRMPMGAAFAPTEVKHLPLASSYTPVQVFRSLYDDSRGLRKGTVFEELYLPLEEGGLPRGR